MARYRILSVKHCETVDGSFNDAIERATAINEEYCPTYGVRVYLESVPFEALWDSEYDDDENGA